ncbi:MAG: MATE family efflux transporter [Caulobacteraceae bacterium]
MGKDLTKGPITKTLILFALPLMGGNALQSLDLTVNQIWVSHTLGAAAVTALGNANIVMFLMLGGIFGVGIAANILVAQAVGARDYPLVKRVMGTTTFFFILLSLVLATLGIVFSPKILELMGTPIQAREDAIIYLRVSFSAVPFMYFFMFMQMAQRGAGDSTTPFYFMAVSVVIDVSLNPMLIRGIGPFPRMGVAGSATSTLVAQSVALIAMMIWLYRHKSVLVLHRSELRLLKPDFAIFRSIVTRGVPMGVQMFVVSGTSLVMVSFVNRYGYLTSAAYSIASIIWSYVQIPTMAIGASVSSMSGQNVGADLWDRVAKIARSGVGTALIVSTSVTILLYIFNHQVLTILLPSSSPAVPLASHINEMVLWGFVIFSITFALNGVIRSTGAVWAPLIILSVSMIGVRIPFAALMIPRFGENAIWWSFPLGTITSAILTSIYYKTGIWKKAKMLEEKPRGSAVDSGLATPAMTPPDADRAAADALAAEG